MDNSKVIYERMQKYVSKTNIPNRYDLMTNEWRALVDKSLINTAELAEALRLVFCYGFEKGCRCTRKEVAVNA